MNWKISLGTQIHYALSNHLGVIAYSLSPSEKNKCPTPSPSSSSFCAIDLCLSWNEFAHWKPCPSESRIPPPTLSPSGQTVWKWGLGEQGSAVSGPFAGAIVLGLNLQKTRASLPCAQAHRSVGQVKGEGAGTPKQRPVPHGRPLSPVEAIRHVASLSSWMHQLPPEGSFLSLACPGST